MRQMTYRRSKVSKRLRRELRQQCQAMTPADRLRESLELSDLCLALNRAEKEVAQDGADRDLPARRADA